MPIIKSAIKRVRQTKARTARNAVVKRGLKAATRNLDAALAAGSKTKLSDLLKQVQSEIDTAVKKNLLHRNKAARMKSAYSTAVKAAGGKAVPAKKSAPTKATAKKKPAAKKAKA